MRYPGASRDDTSGLTPYPFTAAAVSPLIKYRWKNTNSAAIGIVATVESAIAAPHIGTC